MDIGFRGQVTIEFILVLVIILTILATVSIPLVNSVTDSVTDTSVAINLGAAQQRIVLAAEQMSFAGCGSFKNITLFIENDPLADANLFWDASDIGGNFTNVDGTEEYMIDIPFPDYIKLSSTCENSGGVFNVQVEKDCNGGERPSSEFAIGSVCF